MTNLAGVVQSDQDWRSHTNWQTGWYRHLRAPAVAAFLLSVLVSSLGFTTEVNAATCATVTLTATPLGSPQQSQSIGSFTTNDPPGTFACDPTFLGLASDVNGDNSQLPGQTGALTNPPPVAGSHPGFTGGVFGTFTTDGGHLSYTPTSNPGFASVWMVSPGAVWKP